MANSINSEFQRTIKDEIFKKDNDVEYQEGPIKRIERCQVSAKTKTICSVLWGLWNVVLC